MTDWSIRMVIVEKGSISTATSFFGMPRIVAVLDPAGMVMNIGSVL